MTRPIQISLIAVSIILMSLVLAWAIQSLNQPTELTDLQGDKFDQQYISDMTIHHQGAIDMAKLGQTQGEFQPIKDISVTIITDQTAENATMLTWQSDWGYQQVESSMPHAMHTASSQLEGLSGQAFDAAFLEHMIDHHQMAVDMSKTVRNQAKHQELIDLAEQVIQSQSAEIDLMKQWQAELTSN